MLGRAIFGNPWLFHPTKRLPERITSSDADTAEVITVPERLRVMVEHTKLFEEILPHKNFAVMKKHYKAYVNGFDGAKELRVELMEQASSVEIEKVVNSFLENYN